MAADVVRKNQRRLGGGFQENRLIKCVRDREREMKERKNIEMLPKIISHDLKVERWFLTRFSIEDAYMALCQEFQSLNGNENAWDSKTGKANPFVLTSLGGNTNRQLKVNAHRIGGPSLPAEYIASEGPTSGSVFDFWCLVWQEGVERILSVNFPFEERLYPYVYEKTKETVQYWPNEKGRQMTFMPFRITCMESIKMNSFGMPVSSVNEMVYRVTYLRLSYSNPMEGHTSDRVIIHMCYYRWPDGRIPIPWPLHTSYPQATLSMMDAVEKYLPQCNSPLLVHCHAGLGRTGVFIALDMALKQVRRQNTVNIKMVVERLREKRPKAVMNPWQYALINTIVAEKALQEGLLADRVGDHQSRDLIDSMWQTIIHEIDRQFNGELLTYMPSLDI